MNGRNHKSTPVPGGPFYLPGFQITMDFSDFVTEVGEVFAIPKARAGQDIVMTGFAGLAGTAVLARCKKDVLRRTLPVRFIERAEALLTCIDRMPDALETARHGVTAMQIITEGGVFAALWSFADGLDTGIQVKLKAIPIKQETIEVCGVFDVNPYLLLSGGAVLMAADNGNDVVWTMEEMGLSAAVIGKITTGNDRVVLNGDGRRFLTKPQRDELYQLNLEDV